MKDLILNRCRLTDIGYNDINFVSRLFDDEEVERFFILREDHEGNIPAFVDYLIGAANASHGISYIIKDARNNSIGLMTSELIRDDRNGNAIWNVAYAIAPEYRRMGYATEALDGFSTFLLRNFSIQEVSLDISEYNRASQAVARNCGFKIPESIPGHNMAFFDIEHEELGARYKWYKSLAGKRIMYFNRAAAAYRSRDYITSLECFKQALNEEYQPGTPYTDAQIYSNMAMAYSSLGMYQDDLRCLKKAISMGLNNASIQKELMWLRNNKGLY